MALTFSHHFGALTEPAILPKVEWLDRLSPQDEKIALMRQFLPSRSCLGGVIGGAMGSIATEHPFPFLVGLAQCLPGVHAQQKVGGEFQVNATSGSQLPSVFSLNDGNFVVVGNGQDGNSNGIFGQIFTPMGAQVGTEFLVNTHTAGGQWGPSASVLNDGNFVVAWQDDSGQDGDISGIFGQIFNATGAKIGSEFPVNRYTTGHQGSSSVSSLSDGGFVIAWWDNGGQDGSVGGVFGQLFTAMGAKIGNEFQVNTHTAGAQGSPSISSLSNGDFIVSWRDDSNYDGDSSGVFGQLFKATGGKSGSEFQVNTYTPGIQGSPSAAGLSDGSFVVTWQDESGHDGDSGGVFGQLFDATGAKIGSEFQVNTYTTGSQGPSSVSSLNNGNFVVTWSDDSGHDGSISGVFGQLFNATGAKVGPEFQVNTHTLGHQNSPSVSSLNTDNFVVAWSDQTGEIFGQIFDASVPPLITTGTTGTIGTSGTTGNSITTSGSTTGMSPKSPDNSSPSASTNSISWLWPLIGAVGGVTCLAATGFALLKLRAKGRHSDISLEEHEEKHSSSGSRSSLSPAREDKGHTKIGGKYALINKISRDEAAILLEQTGIEVTFPQGKNKTKILLGEGNFGKLRTARNLETGEFAGVKKVKGEKAIQESRDEGDLQAKLEGKPNIMPIWDYVESVSSTDEPVLYQFMPLAGFGNGEELQAHLHARESIQPEVLTHVAQGMATGLDHMHAAGIYHLDIKLSNLVLDMMGEVFIIDFGCAKEFKDGQIQGPVVGDTRYFSPERLDLSRQCARREQITPLAADKVDAWAFGIAILELATGTYPFDQCDIMEKHQNWDAAYFQKKLDRIEFLQQSGGLNEVVKGLLDVNPETRLSIKEARKQLHRLETFADKDEQKAFFASLKKEEVLERREFVSRKENENYADVYSRKHENAELTDYQGLGDSEYSKTPSITTKNEYTKTPASVDKSSSGE